MRLLSRGLGARCAFLLVCFYAAAATAATLQVSTSGSDSNNCLSPAAACRTIQAAINKAVNGDAINVAPGAYAEILFLSQRENLTIAGSTGVVITHPGPTASPLRSNAFVNRSKNIELRDLRITGTAQLDGVQVFDSIGIRITRCILEGTGGAGGALFTGFSDVNIADSTIQDNATGIRVDGNSTVQLGSPQGISTVQRNGVGVVVRSGAFFLRGPAVVQDNGVGVQGQEGATIKLCCQQDGKRRIVNNGIGIAARGASLDLRGPMEMSGNHFSALQMTGGFATITGVPNSASPGTVIRNNGSPDTAAIQLFGGTLRLAGISANDIVISDNAGNGVVLTHNASATIFNTLVTGNGADGVRVQGLSSLRLAVTAIVNGNGSSDLFCTQNSYADGDRGGVQRMFCPSFEHGHSEDDHGPDDRDPDGGN